MEIKCQQESDFVCWDIHLCALVDIRGQIYANCSLIENDFLISMKENRTTSNMSQLRYAALETSIKSDQQNSIII